MYTSTVIRMIKPSDDYLHQRSDDPYWNESGWFPFHVGERRICGWVYVYHRPNLGYMVGGVAVWDPSGEQTWDCLFYDWNDVMPRQESFEMFDFQAPNSLRAQCIEPLKTFRLGYDAEGCKLDLEWNAFTQPSNHSHLKSISGDWGGDHFEQGGRITGTITLDALDGETLQIDCFSNRDHSWGPRKITADTPRGDFPWAVASEEHAFHLTARGTLDQSVDAVDGTTEAIITGWYLKDGEMAAVTGGTRRCVERGEDGRPLRVLISATDALGRELEADGRCLNWLHWAGYPHYFQWWCLTEWTFDGVSAFGEVSDWYPAPLARRWLRNRRAALVTP